MAGKDKKTERHEEQAEEVPKEFLIEAEGDQALAAHNYKMHVLRQLRDD